METRQCTVCKIVKPLSEFYASKHHAKGHRYECKACSKAKTLATRVARVQRPTPELPSEKHCPRCHETLPAEVFSVDAGNASGLRAYCKPCSSQLTRARQLKHPLPPTAPCNECLRLQSERGRTVDPRPPEERFWAYVDTSAGPEACWPWTGGTQKGYGAFGVRAGLIVRAHRFVWELTHGPIPEGLNVLHHCDNPPCCNPHPKHLFLGTFQDNTMDMIVKGRHGTAKTRLTDALVHYIRSRKGNDSAKRLSKQIDVAPDSIRAIWRFYREKTP